MFKPLYERKKASLKKDKQELKAFMAKLEHPLKDEMESVRTIILNANGNVAERINGNAPSYYHKEDMLTLTQEPQSIFTLYFTMKRS